MAVGGVLLAAPPAWPQSRSRATDPFAAVEREQQAARRAEQHDRQERIDEADERTRERASMRATIDDDDDSRAEDHYLGLDGD